MHALQSFYALNSVDLFYCFYPLPAAVMAVVIGVICYLLVSYFRRKDARAFATAIAKKKAADAKVRMGGMNGYQGQDGNDLVQPLIR